MPVIKLFGQALHFPMTASIIRSTAADSKKPSVARIRSMTRIARTLENLSKPPVFPACSQEDASAFLVVLYDQVRNFRLMGVPRGNTRGE